MILAILRLFSIEMFYIDTMLFNKVEIFNLNTRYRLDTLYIWFKELRFARSLSWDLT